MKIKIELKISKKPCNINRLSQFFTKRNKVVVGRLVIPLMAIFILVVSTIFPLVSFARIYVVDINNPIASDHNYGTENLPLKTINQAVRNLHPGDVVLIKAGIYRESVTIKASGTKKKPIIIKAFPGDEGKVIIKGSEIFKNWKQMPGNPVWIASWNYHLEAHYPKDWEDFGPYAKRCEMVFVNGNPLKQVLARGLLRLNTFYVDEKHNRLYIAVPFGTSLKNVEISVRQRGIFIRGSYLRIEGITVMYVANHHKEAAFNVFGKYITIKNCKALWNNLDGFRISGRYIKMIKCVANHNGRCGISASIHNSLIARCITNENSWRFGPTCHAGGMKIVGGGPSYNIIIGHIAKKNYGRGIWFDYACSYNKVIDCFLHGNLIAGLEFEACLEGTLAINNVICHTKIWKASLKPEKTGVGILIYESLGVKILNNTIVANDNYGIIIAGGKRVIHWRKEERKNDQIVSSKNISILNNIITENGKAGLGFWVWSESAKPENLASHKSDYNLWWSNKERVLLPPWRSKWMKKSLNILKNWLKSQDTHSIFLKPQFLNLQNHNFHLRPKSPAIDHGIPLNEVRTDFEGKKHPWGKAPDIGAFEYVPPK